jgi:hypothetical protein
MNSCVLPQTHDPSGLGKIPRPWLRVKRTSVDDFSEIIVSARALPDSNRQPDPGRLAEHMLESVNTVKTIQNRYHNIEHIAAPRV